MYKLLSIFLIFGLIFSCIGCIDNNSNTNNTTTDHYDSGSNFWMWMYLSNAWSNHIVTPYHNTKTYVTNYVSPSKSSQKVDVKSTPKIDVKPHSNVKTTKAVKSISTKSSYKTTNQPARVKTSSSYKSSSYRSSSFRSSGRR